VHLGDRWIGLERVFTCPQRPPKFRASEVKKFTCPHLFLGTGDAIENRELNPVLKHLSPERQTLLFYVCLYLWGQVNGDK